jgi:RNA polymerase sigma-70 factor (ECF subfamily)
MSGTNPGSGTTGGDQPLTTMHVARAVGGDAASLEWLVQRLSPLLRSHAAYRLGSVLRRHYDPDDLVNDAWLAALPKLQELVGGDRQRRTPILLKYLSSTVAYRIQSLARRHGRQVELPPDGDGDDPAARLQHPQSGVVTRALRAERHDLVQQCLAELEPRDREIVLLRGIEQLSTTATAALLGIGAEAAAKRYQRALAKLRARLPDSVFDELGDG